MKVTSSTTSELPTMKVTSKTTWEFPIMKETLLTAQPTRTFVVQISCAIFANRLEMREICREDCMQRVLHKKIRFKTTLSKKIPSILSALFNLVDPQDPHDLL